MSDTHEHHIDFCCQAPYYTLNKLTTQTTHIWIVCHGYGQLGKHFIRRFDVLDPNRHFVIVPQGLSKFYLKAYSTVGASWMTKEDRLVEIENQRAYLHAVVQHATLGQQIEDYRCNFLGFSQGVSTISRFIATSAIKCNHLILWAGAFPPELTTQDFSRLNAPAKLTVVLGDKDQFFQLSKNYQQEIDQMETILGLQATFVAFDGKHEINRKVLATIADD